MSWPNDGGGCCELKYDGVVLWVAASSPGVLSDLTRHRSMNCPSTAMPRHASGANRHKALLPACMHRQRPNTVQPDASFDGPYERIAFGLFMIVGLGATGKTCLATARATALSGAFRDGAWFVDQTKGTEPSAVLEALAATLGIGHDVGEPLHDVSIVADRHAMIASNRKSRGRFQWRS